MKQNCTFEEQVKTWMSTLSPDSRASALSVKDDAFLCTLKHFASLSTRSGNCSGIGIDGATNCESHCSCSWNKHFLISDIENIYRMYCERVGDMIENSLSTNKAQYQTAMTESVSNTDQLVVHIESDEAIEDHVHLHQLSRRQLSKASNTTVGANDEERIREISVGSDAFSIQRGNDVIDSALAKESQDLVIPDQMSQSSGTLPEADTEKALFLIFPAVLSSAIQHKLLCEFEYPQLEIDSLPILSVSPFLANPFDLNDFTQEVSNIRGIPSWVDLLRIYDKKNSTGNTASLSLMVFSRMQISLLQSFKSSNMCNIARMASEVNGQQHRVGCILKLREDKESVEVEPGRGKRESLGFTSSAKSSHVLRAGRNPSKPSVSSSNRASDNTRDLNLNGLLTNEGAKGVLNTESSMRPCLVTLSEIVQKFAVNSDLEELRLFPMNSLPLIPFDAVVQYDELELKKVDRALGKLMATILSRAVNSGVFPELVINESVVERTDDLVTAVPNDGDADSLNLEDCLKSSKKKKKKKKKKRKMSNPDTSHGKEATLPMPSHHLSGPIPFENVETPVAPEISLKNLSVQESSPSESRPQSVDVDEEKTTQGEAQVDENSIAAFVGDLAAVLKSDSASLIESQVAGTTIVPVLVPVKEPHSVTGEKCAESTVPNGDPDDDDAWETVEAKGKGKNRNKMGESKVRSTQSSHQCRLNSGSSRGKVKTPRTAATKKRHNNRKVVKEVLTSLLDSVELEVRRSRVAAEMKATEERNSRSAQTCRHVGTPGILVTDQLSSTANPVSMRDVVLGLQRTRSSKGPSAKPANVVGKIDSALSSISLGSPQENKKITDVEVRSKGTQTRTIGADRSTAPTLPETVSGASANTQSSLATDEVYNVSDRLRSVSADIVVDDSSSVAAGVDEVESSKTKLVVSTEDESPPPLSTLLGPGNTNSATSSVASSLEAPHASKHRHHHHHSFNENDVGYHLLDVCNRLSRDINVFMSRRSLALMARRRERTALLGALQETVSSIWANRGKVELYGSCATQLDLPSSDLDTVILGLDSTIDRSSSPSRVSMKKQTHRETNQHRSQYSHHQHGHPYGRLSSNGERVIMLAAELERQAWAVQVKAIPTASVPVVKILADPSKLPGSHLGIGPNGNWMIRQHIPPETSAKGSKPLPQPSTQTSRVAPIAQGQSSYPPWRGADVMNGLFSIDVTFEGPEHGGIGSTKYSASVVKDACNESGVNPEDTPFVQVLMVLKELLAQRRLNEPFSGGLSSYALLLLLTAVVKERFIIREEMARIERHRELVAAEDTVILSRNFEEFEVVDMKVEHNISNVKEETSSVAVVSQMKVESNPKELDYSSGLNHSLISSSWASIAKKSVNVASSQGGTNVPSQKSTNRYESHTPPSFAEAVVRKHQHSRTLDPRSRKVETTGPQVEEHLESCKAIQNNEVSYVKIEHSSRPGSTDICAPPHHAASPSSRKQVAKGPITNNKTSAFVSLDSSLSAAPSLFPQGSDDVLEVLCSGETSAGKLLMHFLLYYGEHFDARAIAIDVVGNSYDDHVTGVKPPNGHLSPFIPRHASGSIDPVTGMLTVDPIMVYDPWEGGRGRNVARSCYAWSSIQWHFAQCYMTLSSAVERCGSSLTTTSHEGSEAQRLSTDASRSVTSMTSSNNFVSYSVGDRKTAMPQPPSVDVVSPLLELLLSF